ncbi:MAG: hypothetical protein ACI9AO_000759, partial [Ilumatobacter sp.]
AKSRPAVAVSAMTRFMCFSLLMHGVFDERADQQSSQLLQKHCRQRNELHRGSVLASPFSKCALPTDVGISRRIRLGR